MSESPSRGLFVTGTDTGVGKTVIAAAFILYLRAQGVDVAGMKPFQTGFRSVRTGLRGDASLLARSAGTKEPSNLINPCSFRDPLAPLVAADREGRQTSLVPVEDAFAALASRHHFVLVEGVGGLGVPLTPGETVADLAVLLGLPLLVVVRAGLGAISHSVLTAEYAWKKGLEVKGFVLNGAHAPPTLAERTNPAAVEAATQLPVLGVLPRLAGRRAQVAAALGNRVAVWARLAAALGLPGGGEARTPGGEPVCV